MILILDHPTTELDGADAEAPTCQWEYYPPYQSGQPAEGCDEDAVPGSHFCVRHLPDEERW